MESVWNDLLTNTVFVFTVLIGASVLIILYVIKLFKEEDVTEKTKNERSTANAEKKKDLPQVGKRKKKLVENRWTGKHEKYTYSHPWILTSLKGHTGKVLDMDFSCNGKFLTSCDDEDPDPGGREAIPDGDLENTANNLPPDENCVSIIKGLSRRQRKNRKREDRPPEKRKPKKSKKLFSEDGKLVVGKNRTMTDQNSIPEDIFFELLQNYLLTLDQMLTMGYPIQSNMDPGAVAIYKSPSSNSTKFNLNAVEFVPRNSYSYSATDSGKGSSESSDSGEESTTSNSSYCTNSRSSSTSTINYCTYYNLSLSIPNPYETVEQPLVPSDYVYHSRTCCRCEAKFYTTEKEYITLEPCFYHWGKLQNVFHDRMSQVAYSCCSLPAGSTGCCQAKVHVWNGVMAGMNGLYDGFIPTQPTLSPGPEGHYGVYAVDCEMCYTVRGLELTKVTVVGVGGRRVYDNFVLPECEIVDYNTRFSGITEKDLESAKTLNEVRDELLTFINANTILIGHGLENDLRALKIVHYAVVDTSNTFPHYHGLPFRRSLKNLTCTILKRQIQASANGHDSFEDAYACMELMLWKVRKDFKKL